MKNILLLNAGTRNVLVRNFKQTLNGKALVIATDSYNLAPALYDADKYYVTPWITDENYWNIIDDICDRDNIGLIISLIDPELELLSKEKERFCQKGILVNTSSVDVINATYDKYKTMEFIKDKGYSWIKTFATVKDALADIDKGLVDFPLFVKPRCGSGSAGIKTVYNLEELQAVKDKDVIIQEFMEGQEIGVDVYVDMLSKKVCSIFAKKKLKMRSGETDKSVSFKNQQLFDLIIDFSEKYGLLGANDIDVFEKNGTYYISEVNPRFGGGYIHAYACGVDFPQMLINNMNGIKNNEQIGNYEENIYMMKYFDMKVMSTIE